MRGETSSLQAVLPSCTVSFFQINDTLAAYSERKFPCFFEHHHVAIFPTAAADESRSAKWRHRGSRSTHEIRPDPSRHGRLRRPEGTRHCLKVLASRVRRRSTAGIVRAK